MKFWLVKWFRLEQACSERGISIRLTNGYLCKNAVCFQKISYIGGLYAAATDIDQTTDLELMNTKIDKFLIKSGFERDTSRSELGNIITSSLAKQIMGYEQMGYYLKMSVTANPAI